MSLSGFPFVLVFFSLLRFVPATYINYILDRRMTDASLRSFYDTFDALCGSPIDHDLFTLALCLNCVTQL